MESDAIGGVTSGSAYPTSGATPDSGGAVGVDGSVVSGGLSGTVESYSSLGVGIGAAGYDLVLPDCGWDPRSKDQSSVAERMTERVLDFVQRLLAQVLPPKGTPAPTATGSAPLAPSNGDSSSALQTLQQVIGQLVSLVQRLVETISGKGTLPKPQPAPNPNLNPTPTPTPTPAPGVQQPPATPKPPCSCEESKAKRAKRKKQKTKKRVAQAKQGSASTASAASGPAVKVPGAGAGFLWKPISDSDGKLAILLPPTLTGKVSGVRVLSPAGDVLANGRSGGVGNGDREHFRFDRQGGAFPNGAMVEITLKSGEVKRIEIGDTASRSEG